MGKFSKEDFINKRYGFLEVKDIVWKDYGGSNRAFFVCKCLRCGTYPFEAFSGNVMQGFTSSCKCLKRDKFKNMTTIHGESDTSLFENWLDMKRRCYDKSRNNYENYGGKGVCVEDYFMDSFINFKNYVSALDNFMKSGYSLDRIDGTKGYERGNLRWATAAMQSRNRGTPKNNTSGIKGVVRDSHKKEYWRAQLNININGKRKCIRDERYFDDIKSAAIARKELEEKYWSGGE